MSFAASIHELKTLICSLHSIIAIETVEEERAEALVQAAAEQLNMPLWHWSATRGLEAKRSGHTRNAAPLEPLKLLHQLEQAKVPAIYLLKDFPPHLDGPTICRLLRDVCHKFRLNRATLIMTGQSVKLPSGIAHLALYFHLALPDRNELMGAVNQVIESLGHQVGARVQLTREQYDDLLRALSGLTLDQARQTVAQLIMDDRLLDEHDIHEALTRKAQLLREGGVLEYYPAEDNAYELGGFEKLKQWLDRAKVGFSDEARALGLPPPSGFMLVGVPGCGKSLAAKAVARQWRLPLLKLDAGRLFDKYVGESERNFRKAVGIAESMAPVVLWIDEIEKAMSMASGSGGGADGGLGKRIFGAFLTWLQEKKQEVFVVATANDLSSLPPELLRKGRFDEIFFVDLPDDGERAEILRIHLSLKKQNIERFDLPKLVELSAGYTGAEIEQAVISALYDALHRREPLGSALLGEELRKLVPLSVSREEEITALRETALRRFKPVR